MTIKQVLQKYKWAIIVFIVVALAFPFFLNWIVMQHTSYDVAGKPETWIAFWPSYLSAIASFGMIALTAITLLFNSETLKTNKQALANNKEALEFNKEQLDELKRQWEEEHKPNVSVSFNILNTLGSLRIVNTSIVEVKDLTINAELYHNGSKIEEATFPDLKSLKINIEPKGIRNVRILDFVFEEPNTDYFILRLNYNGLTKEPIKVFCNQIYTIGDDMIWREMIEVISRIKK
jgi:hypothetical protein